MYSEVLETAYSLIGVNQMLILKNQKELLDHLKFSNFNHATCIKSFDFTIVYTDTSHDKLNSRLASIILNSFIFKKGNRRYKYLFFGHEEAYFVREHSDSKNKYSAEHHQEAGVSGRQHFRGFAEKVFAQIVGILMRTNCVPLLADIFLYSYEADFIQNLF